MKDDTVEVLVRIPKDDIETIENLKRQGFASRHEIAILNGIVLPKGHGALKDYDAIKSEYIRKMSVFMSEEERMDLLCTIVDEAPTIIDADRGDENG